MNDITFIRGEKGLGRVAPSADGLCGLLISLPEGTSPPMAYNQPIKFTSLKEAEDWGIVRLWDETNLVRVWSHISDYFFINPDAEIWVQIIENQATISGTFSSTIVENFIKASQGEIRVLGVIYTEEPDYAGNAKDDTLFLANLFNIHANNLRGKKMPISVILAPILFTVDAGSDWGPIVPNLRNDPSVAENVSLIVGRSADIAGALGIGGDYHVPDMGIFLGLISKANVNECIGWVEKFKLKFDAINFGISETAVCIGNLTEDLYPINIENVLDAYGYLFFRKYVGLTNYVVVNDSSTMATIDSDYAYLENNRTIDKAIRLCYKALLPKVNSPILVDATNGTLAPEVIKSFEMLCKKELEKMQTASELSGFRVIIDPNQNILSTSKLTIALRLVPTGTAREIEVFIGFENPFNA